MTAGPLERRGDTRDGARTSHIDATVDTLRRRHPDIEPDRLRTWVVDEFEAHRHSRVQRFLPILVSRSIEDRLRGERR